MELLVYWLSFVFINICLNVFNPLDITLATVPGVIPDAKVPSYFLLILSKLSICLSIASNILGIVSLVISFPWISCLSINSFVL